VSNTRWDYAWLVMAALVARQVLTSSVIVKIQELIVPLCEDSESVFQESDDNEETTDGWDITIRFLNQLLDSFNKSKNQPTASMVRPKCPTSPQSCSSAHESHPMDLDHWWHHWIQDLQTDVEHHRPNGSRQFPLSEPLFFLSFCCFWNFVFGCKVFWVKLLCKRSEK
jgi:hypothetical protein